MEEVGNFSEDLMPKTQPELKTQVWLTPKLERMVGVSVAAAILLILIVIGLTSSGYLNWRIGYSSKSVKTETVSETPQPTSEAVEEEAVAVESVEAEPEEVKSGEYTLRGNMSRVGAITMHFTIRGTNVRGYYGYDKYGNQSIPIVGKLERNGANAYLTLYELDEYGDEHGEFIGIFTGKTFSGNFTNYESDRTFSFELTRSSY